ncbi:MAG: helix-turn-helix domain-containing protein [Pseudonocardia sp.]
MAAVQRWTGMETKALRQAMRQTVRGFAEHLGVEPRTVAKWENRGATITLLPESQSMLDTALRRVSEETQERFEASIGGQHGGSAASEPAGAMDGGVVGLLSEAVLVPARIDEREVLVPVDRRTLLRAGTGAALAQLGLADNAYSAGRAWRSPACRLQLTTAGQVEDGIAHLRDQWHLLVKTDNLFGPRYAVRGVLDQLQIIDELLVAVRGRARLAVLKLGAQYAESASWLFEDSGDLGAARRWNCRAMEWAQEADDRAMLSWSLFRRSQQAMLGGDAAEVIGLAQAAGRGGDEFSAPMRAAITQQEAHGYALDGDDMTAQRKLDDAHQWAATDTSGDARGGHGSFCTASYIELQRAACWLMTSKQPGRAIELYEVIIPQLPPVYRRDRGVALGRLAAAYVAAGEPERAARVASEALAIARSAGSARTLDDVVAVGQGIQRYRQMSPVAQFLDELPSDKPL